MKSLELVNVTQNYKGLRISMSLTRQKKYLYPMVTNIAKTDTVITIAILPVIKLIRTHHFVERIRYGI